MGMITMRRLYQTKVFAASESTVYQHAFAPVEQKNLEATTKSYVLFTQGIAFALSSWLVKFVNSIQI